MSDEEGGRGSWGMDQKENWIDSSLGSDVCLLIAVRGCREMD